MSGVATINIDQRLILARKAAQGSLADDWRAVRLDLSNAVERVKRELESA